MFLKQSFEFLVCLFILLCLLFGLYISSFILVLYFILSECSLASDCAYELTIGSIVYSHAHNLLCFILRLVQFVVDNLEDQGLGAFIVHIHSSIDDPVEICFYHYQLPH
jgi:hypothetical protein